MAGGSVLSTQMKERKKEKKEGKKNYLTWRNQQVNVSKNATTSGLQPAFLHRLFQCLINFNEDIQTQQLLGWSGL